MMTHDDPEIGGQANDPSIIIPEVYRHRIAKGLDHLEAFRTAVESYRDLRPGTGDEEATDAVGRILDDAGIPGDRSKDVG